MAGGVQEGYFAALVLNLVSPDVLGYAADLSPGDVALSYGVQEGGFAVVYVAQNGHHGRALHHPAWVVLAVQLGVGGELLLGLWQGCDGEAELHGNG